MGVQGQGEYRRIGGNSDWMSYTPRTRGGIRTHNELLGLNEATLPVCPHVHGGGGRIRTYRPLAYEASELPLLYSASR